MKKIKCPCCGFYTIDGTEEIITDICEVCFWHYDEIAHEQPDRSIGANHVSLKEARENYKKYGACKKKFIEYTRSPYKEEYEKN